MTDKGKDKSKAGAVELTEEELSTDQLDQVLGGATFKFFRPNPAGDGTTEQFFTGPDEGTQTDALKQKK